MNNDNGGQFYVHVRHPIESERSEPNGQYLLNNANRSPARSDLRFTLFRKHEVANREVGGQENDTILEVSGEEAKVGGLGD